MVIRIRVWPNRGGILIVDALVAIAILTIAVLPISFGFRSQFHSLRAEYQKAVAMEIVDGELEILAAGQWRELPEGSKPYSVKAHAAASLPAGRFLVSRQGNHVRLEWTPAQHCGVPKVVREVDAK